MIPEKYLKHILLLFTLIAIAGVFQSIRNHHSYISLLRWVCLLLALTPACVLGLFNRRIWPALRIGIALALLTYLFSTGRLPISRLSESLNRWPWFVCGMLLLCNQFILGALRWRVLLIAQGVAASRLQAIRLLLVNFFFNLVLPGSVGGDLVRIHGISSSTGCGARAFTSVILDRVCGMVALLLICALTMFYYWNFIVSIGMRKYAFFFMFLLITGSSLLILLLNRRLFLWFREGWPARLRFPGRKTLGKILSAVHAYRDHPFSLILAMNYSLLSHLATALGTWCLARSLGFSEINPGFYLLLTPLGLAANAIPLAPGGLGQGQTAFYHLFRQAAGSDAAGVTGALIMTQIHLAMFLMAMAGAVVYITSGHRISRNVEETSEDFPQKSEEIIEE